MEKDGARAGGKTGGPATIAVLPTILCSHCWHEFPPEKILWVANHEDLQGDPVASGPGGGEKVRFRPSRFNLVGDAIDARGQACQDLACPRCHQFLPRVLVTKKPLIFSLVGIQASGKSYFLTSMIYELRRVLRQRFRLQFVDADPLANDILNSYVEVLFRQKDRDLPVAIEHTEMSSHHYDRVQLADQSVFFPRPFLFALNPAADHPSGEDVEQLTKVLCMYDNAGEHFQPGRETTLTPGTRHVAHSTALLFLYDPVQEAPIREKCKAFSKDPQLFQSRLLGQSQATIMTEMALRVRKYAALPPNRKVNRPLLVLISKSDVWGPLLGDVDIKSDPYQDGATAGEMTTVDFARIEDVSRRCRELLLDLSPDFVAAAEAFSTFVVYMPVSALGSSPWMQEGTNMLVVRARDIKPAWVTVPILYSFAKWSSLVGAATSQ